jgi:hypothetical protein
MRSIDEVRERLIDLIEHALKRPGMWGNDSGIQQVFESELRLLSLIDPCEQEKGRERRGVYWHHPLGIIGELAGQHLNWPDYKNEVVSVYAQLVHSLGYWRPARLLEASESQMLRASLDAPFFERDWSESEILAKFGEPSFTTGGGFTLVHANAPADTEKRWIYFDFARKHRPVEWVPLLDDPQLRDVRLCEHHMTLLPFASRYKPGREVFSDGTWVPVDAPNPDLTELDIDSVITEVRRRLPGVVVQRLGQRHWADQFAVWYFGWDGGNKQIRLSSMVGHAPFFVNFAELVSDDDPRGWAETREDAIESVVRYLSPIEPKA